MGRKRRGSQAFNFEQSHETLLQNENIVKLYQNKTFEPPEPKLYETLIEEGGTPTIENTTSYWCGFLAWSTFFYMSAGARG